MVYAGENWIRGDELRMGELEALEGVGVGHWLDRGGDVADSGGGVV